jgi:hypothetical protein
VVVGETLPDRRGADRGVRVDHRVDAVVQPVEGCRLAVDLLPFGRVGGGECLDDGAAADVMVALDRPLGQASVEVAADCRVSLLFSGVGMQDVFSGVTASGAGLPESGPAQFGEGAQDRVRLAACQDGQPRSIDGAVAAGSCGEVAAQVAEGQVVRGGEPAQVGVGGLALVRAGPDRQLGRSPQASSSSSPAAAAGPVTPVTGVAGLRWVNDQGYLLPESAQAGPRYTSGGLASGFADTPLGALVAMINIAVRTAWQFGPAVFQPTIEAQVTGPYANQMLSMDLDAYGTGPGQAGQASSYARMTGYQWAGYTPADATADLVEEGPADDGTTIYAAIQIQAQWVNGDWRVVAPVGGDWANSATQIGSLNGYLTFPGEKG